MVLLSTILGGVAGGASVLQGIGQARGAKHIARAERDIANMQYEYNKKEINRTFKENLEMNLKDQATQRLDALQKAKSVFANVNLSTGNNKNVESESIEHDLKSKTKNDLESNMQELVRDQFLNIRELVNTKVSQTYNVDLNYMSAMRRINNAEIKAIGNATSSILGGFGKMAGAYADYKDFKFPIKED